MEENTAPKKKTTRAKKTEVVADPKQVNLTVNVTVEQPDPLLLSGPVYRPFYWAQSKLGLRLILGIVSLPMFILGLCVTGFRKLVGKMRRKA
jgi:hypothetical protein